MGEKPNILLFLTDDHGAWASGCYGNREIQTPTLDALAAEGTRFRHAFTPSPVCSPARACLLSGKLPSQVGIHDWLQEWEPAIGDRDWLGNTRTLFDILSTAGYHCGLSGKWHLGQSHTSPRGAAYHFGLPGWQGNHNGAYDYARNGEIVTLDGNKSRHITDHAIDFLEAAPANQPFFLNIGYIATHSPYRQQTHDPRQTAKYAGCPFDAIPDWRAHAWAKNEGGGNHLNQEELRDRYIGYYAAASEIDDNIARVISALTRRGLRENTIIIYTSDHGCALGHHGFFGKGNSTRPLNMYETSLRVPLIIAGAGLLPQVADQYVDHCDTFHTICALAGATPPAGDGFAGISYAPLLQGERIPWDDTRFGEYGDLRMIRDACWKLVWRYPAGPHDLYDLSLDPAERENVFAARPEIAARYKARLDAFFANHEREALSGLRVKQLPKHNYKEAWRDGEREARGLQVY